MDPLTITVVQHDDGVTTIRCSGVLDEMSSVRLRTALEQALTTRPTMVRLNCKQVVDLDPDGMRQLLLAVRMCREQGVDFSLDVNRRDLDVLAQMRLDDADAFGDQATDEDLDPLS